VKLGQYDNYADYVLKKRAEYEKLLIDKGRDPSLASLGADILLRKDPVLKAFNKLRTRERVLLQRDNPGLTDLLNKWGYNSVSLQEYRLAVSNLPDSGYLTG